MKIIACYDNMGKTADRYTVFFDEMADHRGNKTCLGMSDNPTHPQGFSQWCAGTPGKHCGKHVEFISLPSHIQRHVYERTRPYDEDESGEDLILEDNCTQRIYRPQ